MIGTIVNVAAIVAGSLVGLAVHARLQPRFTQIVFQGLGLVTVAIGVSMSLKSDNLVLAILAVVAGALIGESLRLDERLERGAERLRQRMKTAKGNFTEGLVTATMLYCVGSMAILGSIEDGLGHQPKLLMAKSLMDGMAAVALTTSFGVGVMFSVVPLFIYQGAMTLFATGLSRVMSPAMVADMTCVGGILLIGLALDILQIKKIKVVNMLPSLVLILVLSYFFA